MTVFHEDEKTSINDCGVFGAEDRVSRSIICHLMKSFERLLYRQLLLGTTIV